MAASFEVLIIHLSFLQLGSVFVWEQANINLCFFYYIYSHGHNWVKNIEIYFQCKCSCLLFSLLELVLINWAFFDDNENQDCIGYFLQCTCVCSMSCCILLQWHYIYLVIFGLIARITEIGIYVYFLIIITIIMKIIK